MLIPYRAEVFVDQEPRANYVLIFAMILAFFITWIMPGEWIRYFLLSDTTILPGILTYLFLHADLIHLIGNVIFLSTFGNAVNCRMGNFRYTLTFLGLGFIAGLLHILIDGNPVLGASGAISGITGMFLFLFPRSEIRFFYFIIYHAGIARLPSIILVLYWFFYDLLMYYLGSQGIAYVAHLSGYLAGFFGAWALLNLRMISLWESDKPMIY